MLLGGEDGNGELLQEVWRTPDGGATWHQQPDPPWPARCGAAVATLPSGDLLLLCGWGEEGHLRDAWLWPNNRSGLWKRLPVPAFCAREDAAVATLTNGCVLVLGGYDGEGRELRDVWVTVDSGQSWQALRRPAWPARGFAAAAALPKGLLVLGGTGEGSTVLGDVWDSNATGSKWRQLPRPPWQPRTGTAVASLPSGTVLLMGGMGEGAEFLQDIWAFETVDAPLSPGQNSPTAPPGKFRSISSIEVEHTVNDASLDVAAKRLVDMIVQDLGNKELGVPEGSTLKHKLRENIEAPFKKDIEHERVMAYTHDEATLSLLAIDVKKALTQKKSSMIGSKQNTVKVAGILRYFEANTKKAHEELLQVAKRHALATVLHSSAEDTMSV